MYVCVFVFFDVFKYVLCVRACVCVYVCVCVRMCARACVCAFVWLNNRVCLNRHYSDGYRGSMINLGFFCMFVFWGGVLLCVWVCVFVFLGGLWVFLGGVLGGGGVVVTKTAAG